MKIRKTPRLFIMMYAQYFVQGAWNMTMGLVLSTFGMSSIIGTAYGALGLATILSPLIIGMIADRFFCSQKVMGTLHLINAGVLLLIPQYIISNNNVMFLAMLFIVGLLFYPTSALANSISFRHASGVKTFPIIRVFGTLGFMSIGFILGQYGFSGSIMTWYIASFSGVCLGVYCFTLPDTPPKAKGENFEARDLFCLDALALFKDKSFSVFMLSTFFLMIPKTAYSAYIPVFLKSLGFDNAATMLQIGTVFEIIFMFVLSFFLMKFGFKKVILLGAFCWIIRCFLLSHAAIDNHVVYILIALMLQSFCWDFFFTAGDIYVDSKASEKIKAQAQSLRFIVSNGIGLMFASTVCGKIFNSTVNLKDPLALLQWQDFWIYPMVIAAIVSLSFFIFFKDEKKKNITSSQGR
ncbi:MFS transporter [Erwinia psidii]|uniref:MFS transporter n=1 Tax=Erwinia psidii TaxID=69224 RepID=A0A3N6S393_9GAMM|nr:MFS transporter [Erwinia psidii]MCX8956784.1 MFS transporter [Erwinia psidii]MCX8960404.1 MFS transporter [Erwinia psidii]MCX8964413.1 MFS transporter [Erwinia psidii]RQM40108.1 MFS transporter [Erwinia psidii]